MLSNIPSYVSLLFIGTTMLSLYLIWRILKKADLAKRATNLIMFGLVFWLLLHTAIALSGFYLQTIDRVPPPFAFVIIPVFLVIIYLFATQTGRWFMDRLPLNDLTWLSIVRIPVELVLYWLFIHGAIPELMTFAGRNFDILAGLTAPVVAIAFANKKLSRKGLLAWNIVGLGLLIFIIVNALLSAPSVLQQFAFDQPNIALLHFPFIWLAALVAPAVLISHIIAIRRLS